MSNSVQVPTIPPPPPVMGNISETYAQHKTPRTLAKRCDIDECTWADYWPELQKACYLAKVCTYAAPKSCQYKNIPSILQEGPTCGLTALSMLLNGSPAPAELLSTAKERKYTNNGEMFSAKNLHQLIRDTIAGTAANVSPIECQLFEGRLNCAKVRDCLLSDDACIFVAYPFQG